MKNKAKLVALGIVTVLAAIAYKAWWENNNEKEAEKERIARSKEDRMRN